MLKHVTTPSYPYSGPDERSREDRRGRRALPGGLLMRILLKTLYWLAVLAISLVLLVALVLFFESRDESNVDNGALRPPYALSA
jgi:hypothetical protein